MGQKYDLLAFIAILMIFMDGCSTKEFPINYNQKVAHTIELKTKSIIGDKHRMLSEKELYSILDNKFGPSRSRSVSGYSIETISEGNKPLIYVVNLVGGGWAVVAGDVRDENQILAYNESGSFDPDNIPNPGVAFWFETVKEMMKTIDYEIYDNEESIAYPHSISYDEPYLWVRRKLGVSTTKKVSEIPHLIQTKWGQGAPWNYKIINGYPTGCVAVAVSQMLYFLHNKIGVPKGLYHQIIPNFVWNNYGYYYALNANRMDYNSDSHRWSQMTKTAIDSKRTTNTDYVGDLMVDVGDHLGMKYTPTGSWASDDQSIFSYFDIECGVHTYDYNLVTESLDKEMPVIIFAQKENSNEGHAWIIDGYRDYSNISDYQYKWVLMPPDSLDYHFKYDQDIDIDHIFTEKEKQKYFPNLVEDEIVHEYSCYYERHLKMNWGYDGEGDDGKYSIIPSDKWAASGSDAYKRNAHMFYDFKQF